MNTNSKPTPEEGVSGDRRRNGVADRHKRRGGDAPLPDAISFRIDDACRLSGLGRTTLYGLARAGKLRLLRIGGRSLIDGDSLRSLLRGGA